MKPKIYRWEDAFAGQISEGSLILTAAAQASQIIVPDVQVPINLSASLTEIVDLYPIETILMTAGMGTVNQNDVMFLIEDTLKAKNTPIDKPLNMNHEDIDIVGHITGSCLVDDSFNLLADESNLPDKLHVKTSAVVYKHWRNKNRQELIEKLIEEINENKWFVSMECLFFNFDYAVKEKNGVYNIIERCDDTSYLTKYLRSFGGDGECDGCKVVMVPRDFIFSGKGFTKNPANLESVIINKVASVNAKIKEKIDNTDIENGDDTMGLEDQVAELKAELDTEKAKAVKAELLKTEAEAKIVKLETKVSELEASDKVKDELIATVKGELSVLSTEKSQLEDKVVTLQAEKLEADRVSTLVSAGIEKADAVEFVKSFANVNDEQFTKIVAIKLEATKKTDKPLEEVASEKPSKTVEPKLEVEPNSTPSLSVHNSNETKDIINSAVAYMHTRKVLGK